MRDLPCPFMKIEKNALILVGNPLIVVIFGFFILEGKNPKHFLQDPICVCCRLNVY